MSLLRSLSDVLVRFSINMTLLTELSAFATDALLQKLNVSSSAFPLSLGGIFRTAMENVPQSPWKMNHPKGMQKAAEVDIGSQRLLLMRHSGRASRLF